MSDAPKLPRFSSGPLVETLRQRNSTMTEAEAKLAVSRVFDALKTLVENDGPVRVGGFGTFHRKFRPGRSVRNPRTGEPVQTQDKHVITFKQGKSA